MRFDRDEIVINGLLVKGAGPDKARRLKKELAVNTVSIANLTEWRRHQVEAAYDRERDVNEKTRQALEMFHDVQTAASSIIRSAERLQERQHGRDDKEKFAALPKEAQTIVKAAGLLELRLRTMPIVTNPAAAEYGNRVPKPIFKIIDRLVRTLQPVAQEKRINLNLVGSSVRLINIYESFDLLPLTLIENAIKYSATQQQVDIEVNDTVSGVAVAVSSLSPWIDLDERQLIFGRRYRGRAALLASAKGSGLGLHIAETVAAAHSTHVLHGCDDTNVTIEGIRFCNNTFRFHCSGSTRDRSDQ